MREIKEKGEWGEVMRGADTTERESESKGEDLSRENLVVCFLCKLWILLRRRGGRSQ